MRVAPSVVFCLTVARYTVVEGVRQRLLFVTCGILVVGLLLAMFAGLLAVTEAQQLRSGVLGAFWRLASVLLVALHVLSSLAREQDDKGLELMYALPMAKRIHFIGRVAGYLGLVIVMVGLFSVVLIFFVPPLQVVLWGWSLFLELWIAVVCCFLLQRSLHKVPSAFFSFLLFYLLARSINSLQLVGHGVIMPHDALSLVMVNFVLDGIALLLPRLDQFTQTAWLAYGQGGREEFWFVSLQGAAYLSWLSGAVLLELRRKGV